MNAHLLTQDTRYGVLYIDNEESSLIHFTKMFSNKFSIFTASSSQEGFSLLEKNRGRIGIVMSVHRMPGEKALPLLEKIKQIAPDILRILVTAYTDLETTIGAINSGKIYKYIAKPWEAKKVETILWEGLNSFTLQKRVHQILNQDFSLLQEELINSRTEAMAPLMLCIAGEVRSNVKEIDIFIKKISKGFRHGNKEADHLFSQLNKINTSSIKKIYEICSLLEEAKNEGRYQLKDTIKLSEAIDQAIARQEKKFQGKHLQTNNNISRKLPPFTGDKKQFSKLLDLLLQTDAASFLNKGSITIEGTLRTVSRKKKVFKITLVYPNVLIPLDIFDYHFAFRDFSDYQICETYLSSLTAFFIIRFHGGSIQVENKQKTTNIHLTFPMHPARPVHASRDGNAEIFTALFLKKSKKTFFQLT